MYITSKFNYENTTPVKVQYLDGNMFSADTYGNVFEISVFHEGEPVELTGTITANIIRPDGATVVSTDGGIHSTNVAYITFPAAVYAIPGTISIIVKLSTSTTVTTIAAIVTNVYEASTDTIVDPGTVLPSIQSLITAINTAVASIPADYSSLWTSLAPAFNASKSGGYAAGEYCTYEGVLYKFNTAHTGAWNSAHVDAVDLGSGITQNAYNITQNANNITQNTNDISDLKSAFGESGSVAITNVNPSGTGTINASGEVYAPTTDNKLYYASVKKGVTYIITHHDNSNQLYCGFFTSVPAIGSVSYNGSRTVQDSNKIIAPITGYIAFRSYGTQTDEGVTYENAKDPIARNDIEEIDTDLTALTAETNAIKEEITDVVDYTGEATTWNTSLNYTVSVTSGKKYRVVLKSFESESNLDFVNFTLIGSPNYKITKADGSYNFSVSEDAVFTADGTYSTLTVYIKYKNQPNASTSDIEFSFYEYNPETILNRLTALEEAESYTQNIVYIGKDGNCRYSDIQDAFDAITDDSASNPYVFVILPGTYNRIKSKARCRYISMIGVDRDKTVILSTTGYYESPAADLWITGTIKNISFKNIADPETWDESQTTHDIAYALHMDYGTCQTRFENCYFETNAGAAAGIGLWQDEELTFDNCVFYSNGDGSMGAIDQGALYVHTTWVENATGQHLILRDNVIINVNGDPGFSFSKLSTASTYKTTFQRNACYSHTNTTGHKAYLTTPNIDAYSYNNIPNTMDTPSN